MKYFILLNIINLGEDGKIIEGLFQNKYPAIAKK